MGKRVIIRRKQIFIMRWWIWVMDRITGQGKNIIRDYITMGISVRGHRVPHRRGMVLMGKSRHGREVWRGTMCIGQGRGLCFFLPKLVDPLALALIFHMPLPFHMVYPSPAYLLVLIHLGLVINLEGSSLLSLFLSFSLPPPTSLLFLPPLPLSSPLLTISHLYCW